MNVKRLQELATERARQLHVSAIQSGRVTGHVRLDGREAWYGFAECPHPDCALVRMEVDE